MSARPSAAHDESMAMVACVSDIVAELIKRYDRQKPIDVRRITHNAASTHGLSRSPKLVDIISAIPDSYRKKLQSAVLAKPIRSASGISVVAVMCKPHRCPHVALTKAVCLYCPGGPDSDFEYSTQAYTGYEPTCLTADHEILTVSGWKSIASIIPRTDTVLTINPKTMVSEWQQVEEFYEHKYHGPLYRLYSDKLDAVCTGNHRWLHYSYRGKNIDATFNTVTEILDEYQFSGKRAQNPKNRNRLLPLSSINTRAHYVWTESFLPSPMTEEQNLNWCRFIGYFLGDGGVTYDSSGYVSGTEKRVVLSQKKVEGQSYIQRLIASLSFSAKIYTPPDGVKRFTFYNSAMYDFFLPMTSGDNDLIVENTTSPFAPGDMNYLQRWLYYEWKLLLSTAQARAIIEGWVAADGDFCSIGKDLTTGYTSSISLREDLATLGALANAQVYIGVKSAGGVAKNIKGCQYLTSAVNWFISFHYINAVAGTVSCMNIATVSMPKPELYEPPNYDGKVYSIKVRNSTYYARRTNATNDRGQIVMKPFFTGNSMRAIRSRYDPYKQTRNRVDQLKRLGHDVDKVEFIVMGGTFMSLPQDYRDYFIRNLHDALSGANSRSVSEAIEYSEQSNTKCIGLTIETRPDWCLKPHISQMLSYGCTRLEVGVQSVYEDVARDTNRGHSVKAVCQSFHLSKDAGFKIIAHMMPDLPNMGYERDLQQFVEYFENPEFRSDGLKIYPTLVIRGTGLYELWKTGQYKNYSPDELIELLCQILALVPPWTRIYRIQRDIPMPLVTSGVEHGNIRELVLARMKELGWKCRDIRTREIGIAKLHGGVDPDQVELVRRDYYANGGWETFLAYEDPKADTLIGLLRLRQCSSESFRPELQVEPTTGRGCSIVRELHVYGSAVPIHSRDPTKFQHQGYGTLLMEEAQRIAREEHGSWKLAVISGVGTRHYYRKLGYELDGPYMAKLL